MSDRAKSLAEAKTLERDGRADEAVRAYLEAGSLNDAVRVLLGHDRYEEAGKLVMAALRVTPADVGNLPAGKRRFAKSAALYFAKAGMQNEAVELLMNLGEEDAAKRVLGHSKQSLMNLKRISSKPPNEGAQSSSKPLEATASPGPAIPPPGRQPIVPPPQTPSWRKPSPTPRRREAASPHGVASAPPREVAGRGPVSQRSPARTAAVRLEQGGALDMALQAFVKQRLYADAARVCVKLGDLEKAASYYEQSGRPFEAAECLFEAGEVAAGLETLVHMPRDHERYRQACVRGIAVAKELGALDFNFDRFVSRFVRDGVNSDAELEAFYELGRLYESHDFEQNAIEAFEHVQAYSPGYRDVEERLRAQEEDGRLSDMVFEKIVREDQAFRARRSRMPKPGRQSRAPELEDLPDLPDLEELDAIQRRSGRPGSSDAPKARSQPPDDRAASTAPPPTQKRSTDEHDIAADIYAIPADTQVSSRYRIDRLVGEGGMAAVYEAYDLELELPIALKIFAVSRRDETLLARFRRELMLARELAHENIVRVYDIGVHAGRRFITMELLSGSDLRDRMDEPVSIDAAKKYLIQACHGLGHAHDRGIVHRDVKPENFYVTSDDVLKVMDFGIAKKQSDAAQKKGRHLTGEGYTAGTPAYMAPEQITDFGSVTHSCDIYSLGIIAFELLTGSLPFDHEESMPLLMMHLNDQPPTPSTLRDLPTGLDDLVLAMLEKSPRDRPRSCAAVAAELEGM